MNKQILLATAVLVATAFNACKKSPFSDYDKTENGLMYKFYNENKDAKKPALGDILTVTLVLKNTKGDSVLFDSRKFGGEQKFPLFESKYKGSIEEGFAMLHLGDSASFLVNPDSFYSYTSRAPKPDFFNEGDMLNFEVKLEKIESKEEYRKQMEQKALEAAQNEKVLTEKYIADNKISSKPDENGLYVIETKKGNGPQAQAGDSVRVHYEGKLLSNGQVFDSSFERKEPIGFRLGQNMVIQGWEIGLAKLKKGSEATFIIPSNLAYGPQGAGSIPPSSTLIFKVSLVDVVKK